MIRLRIAQFVSYLVRQIYCSKGGILLGRVTGAGEAQEITVGSGLLLTGTTLSATGGGAGGGGGTWGSIAGTLSDQIDLKSALDAKAPIASPSFTGTATFAANVYAGDISCISVSTTGGMTVGGGTLTINSILFAYGTGAAAAHRSALGVPTPSTASTGNTTAVRDEDGMLAAEQFFVLVGNSEALFNQNAFVFRKSGGAYSGSSASIYPPSFTGSGQIYGYTLPMKSGTFAMTSDLHSAVTISGNGLSLDGQQLSLSIGTGATQVAAGDHTHAQLHNRSHAMTSTSDHTAGNWKVFYSNGSGQIVELALGSANTVLLSNGASSAPTFGSLPTHTHTSSQINDADTLATYKKVMLCEYSDAEMALPSPFEDVYNVAWSATSGPLPRLPADVNGRAAWGGDDGAGTSWQLVWDGASEYIFTITDGSRSDIYSADLSTPNGSYFSEGGGTGPIVISGAHEFIGFPQASDVEMASSITEFRWMTPGQVNTTIDNKIAAAAQPHYIGITVDGAGAVPATGVKGYAVAKFAGTISAYSIVANGSSPTCTWKVWKVAAGTALPTVSDDIVGAGTAPALTTGNARTDNVTNWDDMTVAVGDIIGFELTARAVATQISLTLEIAP